MRVITALCLMLCLNAGFCFGEVGFIKDSDGYVNLREEESLNAKIIGKVLNDQPFEYSPSENGKWCCVAVDGRAGYIRSSDVISITTLPNEKIREIIFTAYQKQNDWLNGKIKMTEAEAIKFNDDVYDVAMTLARKYVAENQDEELLSLFFENYRLDTENSSESPSIAIGEALLIAPEFVCNQALKAGDKEVYFLLKHGLEQFGSELSEDKLKKIQAAEAAVEKMKEKF